MSGGPTGLPAQLYSGDDLVEQPPSASNTHTIALAIASPTDIFRHFLDAEVRNRTHGTDCANHSGTQTHGTPQIAQLPREAINQVVASVPLGRIAEADEIASAALFLLVTNPPLSPKPNSTPAWAASYGR